MTQNLKTPQRLPSLAPPGTLLKRAFALAQRVKLRGELERNPTYLVLIRQLPCLRCGLDPCGEAAHIRMNAGAHGKHNGMGKKPSDRWTIPLCVSCHREDNDSLHRIGEGLFFALLGLNPLLVAARLYAARGSIVQMRAIAFNAIAER